MKKVEWVKIKGVDFELMGTIKKSDVYFPSTHGANVNDIYERYKKPSYRKVGIWGSWVNWFNMNSQGPNDYLTIKSVTCNFFTIHGYITIVEGKERKHYELNITRYHYRVWEVL